MDYLTVPAMASVPQMEKPITKDDQSQGPLLGPGGSGAPVGGQGPGTSSPTQEGGTVLPLNRLLSFSRSRESRRVSKFSRSTRGSKVTHSSQRSKAAAKPVRRRRKRKRRRVNLKDLLARWWQRTRPHFTYLWQIIYDLTQSFFFDFFICTVVALNTMLLVAQTFAVIEIRGEWFFSAMDPAFLCVYVVEAILKLIALRLKYFHDPWNDIDFFIMVMTVLDFLLPLFISSRQGNRGNTVALFRVLKICKGVRAIRALRFLLTLRVMENLQEVTSTFMLSSQSIGAIILLMFSFLFMSSVVLRDMFHDADEKHFGDLFSTIFTLFQLFTLDDWSLIYLTCYAAGAWYIIIFLIVYILVEYFLLLNLVIAVLVDNFQMALLKRREMQKQRFADYIQPKDSRVEDEPSKKTIEKTKEREETDEEFFRRNVMDKYSGLVLGQRAWELLYSYFQLMTAIETNQQQFYSQATTTDKILDTFFETAEEEEPMH